MRRRRSSRKHRLPGRLELPPTGGAHAALRRMGVPQAASALDVADAAERAETAREPGRARLGLRLSVTAVVIAALFSVLVMRLWSIQVINAQSARSRTIATTTRNVQTPAPRGRIEARGGQLLAGDLPELVVVVSTKIDASTKPATRIANPKTETNLAALVPGLTVKQIRAKLNNVQYGPYEPVPVTSVTPSVAATIEEDKKDFPGATVQSEYVRTYPQRSLAAHVLGYLGPIPPKQLDAFLAKGYQPTDWVGATGLEGQYEAVLHGKPGVKRIEVDPQGNPVRTDATTPPVPGDTVVLNLDLGLEKALDSALSSDIQSLRSSGVPVPWGAAVVLDANNGHVLATTSEPSYNNNEWVGGISDANYKALQNSYGNPLNDYAVQGLQAPGSTFKLATATAALDSGLINPYFTINDPGYFQLSPTQTLHDALGEHPGIVNVSKAITVSSDVFFYTMGAMFWNHRAHYGRTPIQNMANRYGFGTPSHTDLPGVYNGWVDSLKTRELLHKTWPNAYPPATWYLGDNVEMAFGQGETEVTPLEEADAYATFANGGTRYAPELAGEVVNPAGKVVRKIAPKVLGHVPLPPSTHQALLSGFEGVVQASDGTAYAPFQGFDFANWEVGGKTGTATASANANQQPTAWFVAFGGPKANPAHRYVVAVEVAQGGYGSTAAAPVARKVFDYLHAHGGKLPGYAPTTASGG